MILLLLMLSLALLGVWIGWRAKHCHIFLYDVDLWVPRLFVPALTFMVWLGLFIFALGRGLL